MVDSFAYSLGAIIATLPLVACHFGYISLVSLPATFFTLPVLTAVIVLSMLVVLTSLPIGLNQTKVFVLLPFTNSSHN